jgi:excisionase family DNA binding protein
MTNAANDLNDSRLLTPSEVASLFRVDVKTVTRWANAGRITSIRTLGGHRRFREIEVLALLRGSLVRGMVPAQAAPVDHHHRQHVGRSV